MHGGVGGGAAARGRRVGAALGLAQAEEGGIAAGGRVALESGGAPHARVEVPRLLPPAAAAALPSLPRSL